MNDSDYKSKPISRVGQAFDEMLTNGEVELKLNIASTPGNVLAYVSIIVWPIEMKGFRIMESNRPNAKGGFINLVPPALQSKVDKSRYIPVFHIHNFALWFKLQDKVLKHYYELKNSHSSTNTPLSNSEDIPDEEIDEIIKEIDSKKD